MLKRTYIRFLFLCFLATPSQAALILNDYEGVRPAGMGNAFSAIADDYNALWYNPAGLADITGLHGTLVDFIAGLDSLNTFTRISNAIVSNDYQNAITNSKQFLRFGTMPSFITKSFGISAFATSSSYIEIQGLTLPNLNLLSRTDFGAILGFGVPIGRYLNFGMSARGFIRAGLETEITPEDLLNQLGVTQSEFESNIYNFLGQLAGVGYAFGVNAGAIAKLPLGKNPEVRLSATVNDIGSTTFIPLTNGAPTPNRVDMVYTLGGALIYKLSKKKRDRSQFAITVDARRVASGTPLFKVLNGGLELLIPGFSFRAGYHQGDWSAGVTFDALPHTKLSYVTYSKELSDTARTFIRRWHIFRLSIGFQPI